MPSEPDTNTGAGKTAVVVGGGPAGLMAAEALAGAGVKVTLAEAMPTVGRKFLMAGKSGLNLTKNEPADVELARIDAPVIAVKSAVAEFGPLQVMDWAEKLGEPLFTGSTGRVFPVAMKASPLLRRWLARLSEGQVEIRTRWKWTGWDGVALTFVTPDGPRCLHSDITILALGGASWPRLGSDAAWTAILDAEGIPRHRFRPANMGLHVDWSTYMARFFGAPVKGVALTAGPLTSRGEWVVTKRGVEGGGVYEVSAAVRDGSDLVLDLLPDMAVEEVIRALSRPRGKVSLSNHLRKTLGLDPVRRALLMEFARPSPETPAALGACIKALPVPVIGSFPIEGAISSAGGVAAEALDGLMLRARPGTYLAGEMLDWEAPTGGYLLTACLATGRAAALQALGRSPSD